MLKIDCWSSWLHHVIKCWSESKRLVFPHCLCCRAIPYHILPGTIKILAQHTEWHYDPLSIVFFSFIFCYTFDKKFTCWCHRGDIEESGSHQTSKQAVSWKLYINIRISSFALSLSPLCEIWNSFLKKLIESPAWYMIIRALLVSSSLSIKIDIVFLFPYLHTCIRLINH